MIVSFDDYEVTPRYDNTQWTQVRIQESNDKNGPWSTIDTQNIAAQPDPANPLPISFTTELATLSEGWYLVTFLDADGDQLITDPVFNGAPSSYQLLASLDDINAHLDGEVVEATTDNSSLVQTSVNRVVKGFLARVVPAADMATWNSPSTTPDIIREIASMLIAAQVYANETAKSTTEITDNHYSQRLYQEAIDMLNRILDGDIPLPEVPITPIEAFTDLDYFPIDDTDRAFTMGMNL